MNNLVFLSGLTKTLANAKDILAEYKQKCMKGESIRKFDQFFSHVSINKMTMPSTMVSRFTGIKTKSIYESNPFISEKDKVKLEENIKTLAEHSSFEENNGIDAAVIAAYNKNTELLQIAFVSFSTKELPNGLTGFVGESASISIKYKMNENWYMFDTVKTEKGKVLFHNTIGSIPNNMKFFKEIAEVFSMALAPVSLGIAQIPENFITVYQALIMAESMSGIATKEECEAAVEKLEQIKRVPFTTIYDIFPEEPERRVIPVTIDEDSQTAIFDEEGLDEETIKKIKDIIKESLDKSKKSKKNSFRRKHRHQHGSRHPRKNHSRLMETNGPVFQDETSPTWHKSWEEDI